MLDGLNRKDSHYTTADQGSGCGFCRERGPRFACAIGRHARLHWVPVAEFLDGLSGSNTDVCSEKLSYDRGCERALEVMSQDEASGPRNRKERRAIRNQERAAERKEKKAKKFRASKSSAGDDAAEVAALTEDALYVVDVEGEPVEDEVIPKNTASKKRKSTHDESEEQADTPKAASVNANKAPVSKKRKTEAPESADSSKKPRFIVFIGNLPFSTTDASLDKHFEKLKPYTLRHRTDKKTKKSKGFAFIEFEDYDRMKTCLKIYHHSTFDPENPGLREGEQEPESEQSRRQQKRGQARKINVELTAGGGGGTEARMEKIKAKNVKLDEQRARRADAERKEKVRKQRKAALAGGGEAEAAKDSPPTGIHPSRMAQISG